MQATKRGEKRRGDTICGALKHPLRVRILEILNDGPRSPSQFVEEGRSARNARASTGG